MRGNRIQLVAAASLIVAQIISSPAFAAGFEKNILWSGKWTGVGGAAVSGVQGAESLFFNPAGLAGREGGEVSGNFSPTWGRFEGPTGTPNVQNSTGYEFSPVFGVLASYGLTSRWGIGVGEFVSAGTKADYGTISNFSALVPTFFPDIHSHIYATETSIGTGYELIPGLKIGAAWRIVHVNAGIGTVYLTSGVVPNNAVIDDLSGTRYNGFRAGVQYNSPDQKWGLGATWRSSVDFRLTGTSSVVTYPSTTPVITNGVTVVSGLPTQVEVGGNYAFLDTVRGYLDYVWTNYSHDQSISITGGGVQDINLGWTNMSNVRIGAACTAVPDWIFRAGYVYTSQVTPNTLALAPFASPGHGSTVTLGAGRSLLEHRLDLDGAIEHSWASGTTTASDQTVYGLYDTSDWVLHAGATLRF